MIITDCTCDLPDEMLERYGIELLYFYIHTEKGRFRDRDEITAVNVFEHMGKGGKTETGAPPSDEYAEHFRSALKKAENIIYIPISSCISLAYENSLKAKETLGDDGNRIYVLDSKHLSTGLGHVVLGIAELIAEDKSIDDIISEAENLMNKVSTTFIVRNADYLYKNGKVGKNVQRLCSIFNIHPVLTMKNGNIGVKRVFMGNYEKAQINYIKNEMKKNEKIKKKLLFITHAGCSVRTLAAVRKEIDKYCTFEKTITTTASATVSSNCGPQTVGVLYVTE